MSLQDIFGLISNEILYTFVFLLALISWIWIEPFLNVVLPTFAFFALWLFGHNLVTNFLEKIKIKNESFNTFLFIVIFIGLLLIYDYFSLSFYYYDFSIADIFRKIRTIPIIRYIPL